VLTVSIVRSSAGLRGMEIEVSPFKAALRLIKNINAPNSSIDVNDVTQEPVSFYTSHCNRYGEFHFLNFTICRIDSTPPSLRHAFLTYIRRAQTVTVERSLRTAVVS